MVARSQIAYLQGWYPEEHAGRHAFRWMMKEAVFRLDNVRMPGRKYVRFFAAHAIPDRPRPALTVTVNGGSPAVFRIDLQFSSHAVPFEDTGDLEVRLMLDQLAVVEDDPRDLGIMLRQPELVTPSTRAEPLEGWYESDGAFGTSLSRWIKPAASVLLQCGETGGRGCLRLCGGLPCHTPSPSMLSVSAGSDCLGRVQIWPGFREYSFPLKRLTGAEALSLTLDERHDPPGGDDARELGMVVESLNFVAGEDEAPLLREGWHGAERGERDRFRWSEKRAVIAVPRGLLQQNRYLALRLSSEFTDGSQRLTMTLDGKPLADIPLLEGWHVYSVEHQVAGPDDGAGPDPSELVLRVNRLWSPSGAEGDARERGVKLANTELHDDDERHRASLRQQENARLNHREMMEGRESLDSFPVNLGIDLYGRCNMKPPCVYCAWDETKDVEKGWAGIDVGVEALQGYGRFFTDARSMTNCSFGEPFLHPEIVEILECFERHNLHVELATNGQAFRPAVIEALAGKRATLYISLDAATRETYARIRNDRWDDVVVNLEALHVVRRLRGNRPQVFMVFMPMKVNRHELEDYFRLCRDTGADGLVLRPLNYRSDTGNREERAGYLFDYREELLGREDIEQIVEQSTVLSRNYDVPLINQFSFGQRVGG